MNLCLRLKFQKSSAAFWTTSNRVLLHIRNWCSYWQFINRPGLYRANLMCHQSDIPFQERVELSHVSPPSSQAFSNFRFISSAIPLNSSPCSLRHASSTSRIACGLTTFPSPQVHSSTCASIWTYPNLNTPEGHLEITAEVNINGWLITVKGPAIPVNRGAQ